MRPAGVSEEESALRTGWGWEFSATFCLCYLTAPVRAPPLPSPPKPSYYPVIAPITPRQCSNMLRQGAARDRNGSCGQRSDGRICPTPGRGEGGKEAQALRDRRLEAEFRIWLTLHEPVEDAETQQGGWGELSPGWKGRVPSQHCGRQGLFNPVVSV